MMRSLERLILVLLIALLGWGRLEAQQTRSPQARPGWEYKALSRDELEDKAAKRATDRLAIGLEQLAKDGWELIEILPKNSDREELYLFGRPDPRGRRVAVNGIQIVSLKNADAASMVRTLSSVFPSTAGWTTRFLADERTNSVIIVAGPGSNRPVLQVLQALDVPVGPSMGGTKP